MIKKACLLFFCLLLFLTNTLSAVAREEVTSFKTYVNINTDGSVDVTDIISVNVEHQTIKLGLVLDFYKSRPDEATGKRVNTDYDFISVKRNGKPENFWTEKSGKKVELLTGAVEDLPENFIPTGINTYEIKYRIKNMISFFSEEDGFYYNVTGNEWDYRIKKVYAEIHLPSGAQVNGYTGYTGSTGSKREDYYGGITDSGAVWFETLSPLGAKEGFTVSVSFSKGFVNREKNSVTGFPVTSFEGTLASPLSWCVFIPAVLFLYYVFAWLFAGRDLPEDTAVPSYIAPKGISPVIGTRLLNKPISSQKEIVSILISLISKGYISLIEENEKYKIKLERNKEYDVSDLSDEEAIFFRSLFCKAENIAKKNRGDGKISMFGIEVNIYETSDNEPLILSLDGDSSFIYGAYCRMRRECSKVMNKYIITNTKYKVTGILFTFILFAIESFFSFPAIFAAAIGLFSVLPLAFSTLIFRFVKTLPTLGVRIFLYIMALFWLFPFLGVLVAIFFMTIDMELLSDYVQGSMSEEILAMWIVISLLVTILINFFFFFVLNKKTPEGVKAVAAIKGLYVFMEKVEKDRYAKITPDIFERNLAYAVAFDFEKEWVERFRLTNTDKEIPLYYRHFTNPSFHKAIYKSTPAAHSSSHHHSRSSRGGGHSGGGGGHGGGHGR